VSGLVTAPQIPGLSLSDQALVNKLVAQITAKARRNQVRRKYYDHKAALRDLGIAIPPQLKDVSTVLGWPAKGVDSMSRRTVLEGFTVIDGDSASMGLDDLLIENRIESEAPQAHTSALIHSAVFTFITAGDIEAGEPAALISTQSAEWATGTWDRRRRRLSDALSVIAVDDQGSPTHMNLYTPGRVVVMRRDGRRWDLRLAEHDLGVPVEVMPYRPSLDRPFGASRISRPVMALTDAAVRTMLRTEVSAEFFSAPQRYLLGGDEDAFTDKAGNPIPGWSALLGRILAVGLNEEGGTPTVGQFAQQSMEPHLAQTRSQATLLAAEMSLPVGSLGIVQDNPSSAEAIEAAKEELVVEIRHWEKTSLAPAWQRTVRSAMRLVDDSPAARAMYAGIRAHWSNPATPSVVSASDAVTKQVAAIPRIGETTVALEKLGYSTDEIGRMQSEWRRADGGSSIDKVLEAARLRGAGRPAAVVAAPAQPAEVSS